MFATLLGPLPRPPLAGDAPLDALVLAAVEVQEAAGIEPVTDGSWWGDRPIVDAWRDTAALSGRAVKQVLIGPMSIAGRRGGAAVDEAAVDAAAQALNLVLRGLAEAGCPLIEIHEPALVGLGHEPDGWRRFARAHRILAEGVTGSHLSLAITGGAVDRAGYAAIVDAPYASLAVDLIAGPDHWRLVRATPGTRGIVCGALSPLAGSDDGPETLLWAAAYAASGDGRGPDRVGLATASSLAGLPWETAVAKLRRLGEAARLADLPADRLREQLDPRSIDSRSAALGSASRPKT